MRLASLRRPPRACDRRVAFTALSLLLVAAALLLAIRAPGASTAGRGPASRAPKTPKQAPPRRSPDLEQATAVARHFLRAYLSVVYGHTSARLVPNAAPGVAATLVERRRVPPALRRLHPRIVSVTAIPDGEVGGAEVTARISDGEVVTYPIRLLLARSSDGQLVVANVGAG